MTPRLAAAVRARDAIRRDIERLDRAAALARRLRPQRPGWTRELVEGVRSRLRLAAEMARLALDDAETEYHYALAEYRGVDLGEDWTT